MSRGIDVRLALVCLQKSLDARKPEPGRFHHPDHGVQYPCRSYVQAVVRGGRKPNMSSKACPYDNAKAESFFATLKKEEVHLEDYGTLAQAEASIGRSIGDVYNAGRLHSSLGYEAPAQFEAKLLT